MPKRQRSQFTRREALSADAEAWLNDEPHSPFYKPDDAESFWSEHSERIVAEHVDECPGSRPPRWWEYDAPRSPLGTYRNRFYDGKLPEPRKRLGGTGTPAYEVLNVVPSFSYGLPNSFVDQWDVDYYTGVGVDVHGKIMNPNPSGKFTGVAIDLEDPPVYESQASYLDRLGLFLPGEKKRLKKADFAADSMLYA